MNKKYTKVKDHQFACSPCAKRIKFSCDKLVFIVRRIAYREF